MLRNKMIAYTFLATVVAAQSFAIQVPSFAQRQSQVHQELQVRIESAKPVVIRGQAITLNILVTNTSRQAVHFLETKPASDFQIKVRDSRGRLCPLTEAGRMANSGVAYRRIITKLLPGKATAYTLTVNHYVDMSARGKYTIFLERNFIVGNEKKGNWKTARSNLIEVRVK